MRVIDFTIFKFHEENKILKTLLKCSHLHNKLVALDEEPNINEFSPKMNFLFILKSAGMMTSAIMTFITITVLRFLNFPKSVC